MPRNYTTGGTEPDDTLDVIDDQQPYYAGAIEMEAPVDSQGERYRKTVEFDLSSVAAYDAMVIRFPTAWEDYYTTSVPAYSGDNAVKLQEAIKFYLYINEGETANVEPYLIGEGEEENELYEGIVSKYQNAFEEQPRISPYMKESGGTYENPDGFYNQEVFDRVEVSGRLPLVQLDGDTTIASRATINANLSTMYSTEQLALKEYQVSRSSPKSDYDWGGSYAATKNTY